MNINRPKTSCRSECTSLPEFKGGLVLNTENSAYLHSSHWGMLLPSSRAACPDVEEIILLFVYTRIYTGIWGLKRISLSFVLILALFQAIQWPLL